MKALRVPIAVIFAAALSGCASVPLGPACRDQVVERLYFGLAMPGREVTESDWQSFVDAEVGARFPEGFTVYAARGQWRGAGGAVQRERSRVLEIVHTGGAAEERKIAEITERYRIRFCQESVLRVTSRARACF